MRLVEIRRTTHRHTATNQTNQSRKSWKSTPRTVANVSFSWNKYEQRLNNIKKTFFTLNRDKLRINLSSKSVGKYAYRPPSWIFLCFSLWPLYSLSLDRAFETIPQAYSRMKIIIFSSPNSWPPITTICIYHGLCNLFFGVLHGMLFCCFISGRLYIWVVLIYVHSRLTTVPRGSQWGGGFYGYRLKFWLFYGYRLIFFSYG